MFLKHKENEEERELHIELNINDEDEETGIAGGEEGEDYFVEEEEKEKDEWQGVEEVFLLQGASIPNIMEEESDEEAVSYLLFVDNN